MINNLIFLRAWRADRENTPNRPCLGGIFSAKKELHWEGELMISPLKTLSLEGCVEGQSRIYCSSRSCWAQLCFHTLASVDLSFSKLQGCSLV